jgi:hypothetical protein
MLIEDLAPIESIEPFTRRTGENNWFNPHVNALQIETRSDDISNHEMNHLLAHASTPYGFFLQTLADLQTRVAADYFEQSWLNLPELKIPLPVREFAQSRSVAHAALLPFVDQYVKPWSWLVFLERVFEGENLQSVREAKRRDIVRALNHFEELFTQRLLGKPLFDKDRTSRDEQSGLLSERPLERLVEPAEYLDRPASNSGKWFGRDVFPLGAAHVMETLAQQVQSDYLSPGPRPIEGDFDRPGAELYWFLYLQAGQMYGIERMKTPEGYRKLYNTIIALCDLALFTPVGPVYGRLRFGGTTWNDINPAMRYARALQVVESVGWIDDLATELKPFQNEVCQFFGWPTPDQCLRLGATIEAHLPVWERHRDACELRLRNPLAFLIIERSHFYDDFLDRHLPVFYHANVGEVVIRSWKESESIELLINYFLSKWCWNLMIEGARDYATMLPPRLRFDRLNYPELKTPSDFLKRLLHDNPWMEPSRFASTRAGR